MKQKREPSFLYDIYSNSKARKNLRNLARQGYTVSKAQKQLCDQYARDVLGSSKYAPWLEVFTAVQGQFKEGWIPHNYYRRYIVPRKKGWYGEVSALGGLSPLLFDTNAFPNVGYFINGAFYSRDRKLLPHDSAAESLFSDSNEVVFKTDSSMQGKGIQFFSQDTFDPDTFNRHASGVFQKRVFHHLSFDRFGSKAAATIRVVTVIDADGRTAARVLQLRLGASNDTHIRGATQLKTCADIETGELDEVGFYQDFTTAKYHRDNGEKLGGFKIPHHKDVIALVTNLHQAYPFAQTIGWDVVVDVDNHLHILEWNGGHSGIHFFEAAKGPLFSDLSWENEWKF